MRSNTIARTTTRIAAAATLAVVLGACGSQGQAGSGQSGSVAADQAAPSVQSVSQPMSSETASSETASSETASSDQAAPAAPASSASSERASEPAAAVVEQTVTVTAEQASGTTATHRAKPAEKKKPAKKAAPVQDEPLSAAAVGAEAEEGGRTEAIDSDGGIVVDGTTVTFVFVNGTQYSADLEVPIDKAPFQFADGNRALVLETDGAGVVVDGKTTATINPDGSGAIVEEDGTSMSIDPTGSAYCVDGDSFSWSAADGSGGTGDKDGFLVIDGSGTSRVGTQPPPEQFAGRFTACNIDHTAKADLSADVLFDFGSAELTTQGRAVITDVAETMAANGVRSAKVTGHTDWVGSTGDNLELGQRRADAVAELLTAVVPDLKVTTDSAGESLPIAANANPDGTDNPAGRAQNRRVEIVFATG